MIYRRVAARLPGFLDRRVRAFEARVEDEAARFAATLAPGARVVDAGAGECRHRSLFARQRYLGVDLGVGDARWDYGKLDVVADLARLPFSSACFDASLCLVTLEHVAEPGRVLAEIARVLKSGGRMLLVAPQEWEIHQAPHDYYRFTRYGLRHLIEAAGLELERIEPAGGFFCLLARRLLNSLQFFPGVFFFAAAMVFVPAALLLPLLDGLDRRRDFTLGYLCTVRKPS
jgi:SAM-dependent methyltransferase